MSKGQERKFPDDSDSLIKGSELGKIAIALERLARINAVNALANSNQRDKVVFLTTVGYAPAEIAAMLGIPSNQVSVVLYRTKPAKPPKRSGE